MRQTEHDNRLKSLQDSIQGNHLDAFLVTSKDSIYYLTGLTYDPVERPFFILVPQVGESKILSPTLEREHLRTTVNLGPIHTYWDYPSPAGKGWPERLNELVEGVDNLGVEPSLSQEIALELSGHNPLVLPLIEELRLLKSNHEIAMLRQAAGFVEKGMNAIIKGAYYGVSEIEIFSLARSIQMEIIKTTDFDPLNTSILTAAWPARLALQPHGIPRVDDYLESGPHIALSFMRVNGYGAECERTFFVEAPTSEMIDMFILVEEARKRALDVAKPGVPCVEIDQAANGFLRDEGVGEYLMHRTGHGFGLGNHERPWVAEGSEDILKENMLISIEPGIYKPGLGAFRHSDTFLVTKDGCENLTPYPSDLESLTILKKKVFTRLCGAIVRRAVGIK